MWPTERFCSFDAEKLLLCKHATAFVLQEKFLHSTCTWNSTAGTSFPVHDTKSSAWYVYLGRLVHKPAAASNALIIICTIAAAQYTVLITSCIHDMRQLIPTPQSELPATRAKHTVLKENTMVCPSSIEKGWAESINDHPTTKSSDSKCKNLLHGSQLISNNIFGIVLWIIWGWLSHYEIHIVLIFWIVILSLGADEGEPTTSMFIWTSDSRYTSMFSQKLFLILILW